MDLMTEIQVEQAIGMAAESQLRVELAADDGGNWPSVQEDVFQPMQRVRVEVRIGSADYVPLIDGPIVTQKFDFSAEADHSTMTLLSQDDSALLNQEEGVEVFEDTSPDQIASTLMEAAGLTVEADPVPDAGSSFTRYVVRRGTAMRLLRDLARQNGMNVFVRPGDTPGSSVGVFQRPNLTPGDLPELVGMGADRNVNNISVEFDALRPSVASAGSVRFSDKSILTSDTTASDLDPRGDSATHDVVTPGQVLLARSREEQTDIDAATQAAVNSSSFAYTARGEVTADIYAGVLQPYQVVAVSGIGGFLSGDYLISAVTHILNADGYRQRFTLVRNARLNGSASTPSGPGVF